MLNNAFNVQPKVTGRPTANDRSFAWGAKVTMPRVRVTHSIPLGPHSWASRRKLKIWQFVHLYRDDSKAAPALGQSAEPRHHTRGHGSVCFCVNWGKLSLFFWTQVINIGVSFPTNISSLGCLTVGVNMNLLLRTYQDTWASNAWDL